MELLLIIIPFIIFLSLFSYILVKGIYQLMYGLRTGQRKKVIEGIVVLFFFVVCVVALCLAAYNLWHKHGLEM